jgi:hypothetical protein
MKSVAEWGAAEWGIVVLVAFFADRIIQHIAYYVGIGAAVLLS